MKYLEFFAGLLGSASEVGVPDNQVDIMVIINLVLKIVIAGINYSLSSGDPAKTASAKNTILYAVIGLVIIASAIAITGYIIGKV